MSALKGKIVMADGFQYDGAWKAGEISGQGVATYANGDVYKGNFENGRQHGYGTMTYASGAEFKGYWGDGRRDKPAEGEGSDATSTEN